MEHLVALGLDLAHVAVAVELLGHLLHVVGVAIERVLALSLAGYEAADVGIALGQRGLGGEGRGQEQGSEHGGHWWNQIGSWTRRL